ncbi:FAD binding domain protein [Collimonas arenae]|uniref:FAD binding domain protein n=1 Tax=Collimonas arenae TaxID=279058 RepID=A0A127QI62_9BURK|nr:D-amino acid dehydrogenase [Collimonas arenae]AMO99852.1 FAD binding domain protein [Collimonas arenae]AMP09750.1 FAD binding domain protein [Collimonas arenae]
MIQQQTQKQIVVIGGGVMGVCSAYFLAEAGHQVAVVEQRSNVAEESTLGNSGILSAGSAMPWSAPGMRKAILAGMFNQEAPNVLNARFSPALWRWMRRWMAESELQRFRSHTHQMQRLASYSQDLLQQIEQHYQIDFEQSPGLLRLFRSEAEIATLGATQELLTECGVAHQLLDGAAARALEPALANASNVAGGLYFPDMGAGNCTLFTKQLKAILQGLGVQFHFDSAVTAIEPQGSRVALHIDGQQLTADAVVCATGSSSAKLLKPLGLRLPLHPIKTYTATAAVKNYEDAPKLAILDPSYKVTMARIGSRIRLSGIAEFGAKDMEIDDKALRTLLKVAHDWFPDAANFNSASFWCGHTPMLADEVPLIGHTGVNNVFVNIAHGGSGWSMALGAAKVLADQVSGRPSEVDLDGLTIARYR